MNIAKKEKPSTRQQLINAAEKLFADRGIDNVSLVDISRTAGQKNRNALQYHFGDKAGLINAVLDKHSEGIALVRGERLDKLEDAEDYGIADIIEVLVRPVAEMLTNDDGGVAYININSQLMSSKAYAELRMDRVASIPQARRMEKMTLKKLPISSKKKIAARMLIVDCMLFHCLSAYTSRPSVVPQKNFIETLIESITAVLLAQ
jgi:AcrR family transcriptional regulator